VSTDPTTAQTTRATQTTPAAPRLLKQGVSGPEVTALQNTLNELGYWNGEADGSYGDLTAQAVMAYQKAAGIAADGVAGPDTQKAIAEKIRPSIRTTSGNAIEVDLQAQLVKVVIDGSLKYTFNTSTGSGQTYLQKDDPDPQVAITPTGKFTIQRSIDGMRTSKLGKLWRPRYFYEGYALHGATYVPNYPASHGCVRLANPVIDFVWSAELAPIGRTVWVY
jgi:lipoprotein-anchoring transpeptidase ErfK/SrfK